MKQTPPELLLGLGEAVLLALRALQAVEEPKQRLSEALREVAVRLDELPETARAALQKALTYLYLLVRHKRASDEQEDLFAILDKAIEQHMQEREEAKMTGGEVLIRQGREEGRRIGREEGKRSLLIEQMRSKFGQESESLSARINGLPREELDRVCKLIRTAQSLEDLGL